MNNTNGVLDESNHEIHYDFSADAAMKKLLVGNKKFVDDLKYETEVSPEILKRFTSGQKPYAIIVTCSDSRVIPELIFSAGIGDLFVIRVAGNVIDSHQLGSIEYAAEHLGTGLVVVLGHTRCGAVDAVLSGHSSGYIKYIADEIVEAIGDEKDPHEACRLNVVHSVDTIEHSLQIQKDEEEYGLRVVGAIYDLDSGVVEFLDD